MAELTREEEEVLVARIYGDQLTAIAARLGLHWGTVARYQHRAVSKLLGPKSKVKGYRRLVEARRVWERQCRDKVVRAQDINHDIAKPR